MSSSRSDRNKARQLININMYAVVCKNTAENEYTCAATNVTEDGNFIRVNEVGML